MIVPYSHHPDPLKKRLKIAVLIRRFITTGGAEKYAVEVTKRLAETHNVHVFAQEWVKPHRSNISFHRVPKPISRPNFINQLWFSFFTARALDNSFDIIHSHERVARFDVLTVHCPCYRGFITEKKTLYGKIKVWISAATSLRHLSYLWLEKQQFSHGENRRFIAVSNKVKKDVQANYPMPDHVFRLAYPGVDLAPFDPQKLARYRARGRADLKISEDTLVILFVGTEFKRKGLDVLIKAYALLDRAVTRLLIAGGGDTAPYISLAKSCGVSDTVMFLGLVDDMKPVYAMSDVFVLPTRLDPYAMAPIEAMALGIATITSGPEFAGSSENVKGGQALLLDHPESPEAIAKALIALIDSKRRLDLGRKGQELAKTLTWDKTTGDTFAAYTDLLNR